LTLVVNDKVTIVVADLQDVIASKEWADRPKDREALPELRGLLAEMELEQPSWPAREPPNPERDGPGLGL
jgi:hypothetical protein